MNAAQVEAALMRANAILGQIDPLIGTVGALAALVIRIARRNGTEVKDLETEIAGLEAKRNEIRTLIAQWNAEHPQASPSPASPGEPRGD